MAIPDYGKLSGHIARLSEQLFQRVLKFVRQGMSARAAIKEALQTFEGPYIAAMSEALSRALEITVDDDFTRSWPVRDVTLSEALYDDARAVSVAATLAIKDHDRWLRTTRSLALKIYEGYDFKEREVLKPAVKLPKYMRDAAVEGDILALFARQQASGLKTKALKAGYMQALDAILKNKGAGALNKALYVAVQERYRYFANRIAQTEVHRAHTLKQAARYMQDDAVEVIEYRLSASHPRPDICDIFAKQNAYGLGPGLYPKGAAPAPPIHPHCRCLLRPRLDISAKNATYRPDATASFLHSMDLEEAAQLAGSQAKAEAILDGVEPMSVFNAGKPKGYKIGTVKQAAETFDKLVPTS